MPALDGLRGLAVAGVLVFHADLGVMVGGYLGVSSFFTLSGFLITSLLLRESQGGEARLGRFWGRRLRRLLPASLMTLAAVLLVFAPLVATSSQRASMQGDVLASLFDVANWWFVLTDSSYGALFVDPSPVLHFWSLAIEEQFYLLFPLVLVGLWRLTGGRRRPLAASLLAFALVGVCLPFVFSMSDDRVYFGTDTRAPELLVGAVLAVVVSSRGVRRRLVLRHRRRDLVAALGAVALVVQLYLWWTLEQSTSWLYRGGFALYALLSCVVILAGVLPAGPVRSALAIPPLRWLGARSYGVYLIHWPLFLAFDQLLPDVAALPRAAAATAVTMVLAEGSYRFVEQPIRHGRWPVGRTTPVVAVAAMTTVALLTFLPWARDDRSEQIDFEQSLETFEARRDASRAALPDPDVTTTTAAPMDAPDPRIATFGDSTALQTAIALANHRQATTGVGEVLGDVALGCSVSRFEANRFDVVVDATAACTDWPTTWPEVLATDRPDIAQLVTGAWEVPDVRLPGAEGFSALGDPAVDAFVLDELRLAVDTLSRDGAMVLLWLWPAYGSWAADGRSDAYARQADPARMARLHELMRQVAAERPDTVRVLDFAGWFGARAQDPALRPDGIHISEAQMTAYYDEWVAAETDRIWTDWWREHRAPAQAPPSGAPTTTPTTAPGG
jgi:peptidoglycan/LPS O-acetylase OafA/YrhL